MKWFSNLKTSQKLLLSFGAITLALFIIMGSSYSVIHKLNITIDELHNTKLSSIETIGRIEKLINSIRALGLTLLLTNNRADQEKLVTEIKKNTKEIEDDLNVLSVLQGSNKNLLTKIDALKKMRSESTIVRDNQIIPLVLEGKLEEARKVSMVGQDERYETMKNIGEELTFEIHQESFAALKSANREVEKATVIFLFVGIVTIIFAFFLTYYLNLLIADPLKKISLVAKKIAFGDIEDIQLETLDREDEVGVLSNTFIQMSLWLQKVSNLAIEISNCNLTNEINPQSSKDILGNSFLTMQKNLIRLTGSISEMVNNLSSSATEISSSTAQLTSSSSETATSVNETTSTIEEVKQTSQIASQKAKAVSETAQKSAKISELGKQAAEEITSSIDLIRNQMELIAESMVKLNEQTQAIGSIIESVDDLAQQSNLLAVNASIEAAKAGEQGKGFSVVAQEVKSLAHQSKQATNQVRTILGDIQKATTSAVMATEQGSKAVEAGVKKSEETGESILSLVSTVKEASQAATQIAAISHQQLVGMEEAALAMENIKQASSQNVESAKQLEISASNIKELGSKLKELLGQYKIKSEGK